MAGPTSNAPDPRMDVKDLYREDTYSDRKVGTIRVMTPVTPDGTPDPTRATTLRRPGADHDARRRAAAVVRDRGEELSPKRAPALPTAPRSRSRRR